MPPFTPNTETQTPPGLCLVVPPLQEAALFEDSVPRPPLSPQPQLAKCDTSASLPSQIKDVPLAELNHISDAPANTNPEPPFALTADGSTRVEWASWPRAETLAKEISPKRAAYLYAMLTFIQEELSRLGIRCYADGGSLLGQVRDGGIIRFDDDIDLQIHPEDGSAFLANAAVMAERVRAWGSAIGQAAELIWVRWGYKVVLIPTDPDLQVLHRSPSLPYWYPEEVVIDLFLMDIEVEGGCRRVAYGDRRLREMLRLRGDGHIAESRLGSLRRAPFGPTSIYVPEHAAEACKDVFGPLCFDQVVCKDGRNGAHNGASVAVPMDEESTALFKKLMAETRHLRLCSVAGG